MFLQRWSGADLAWMLFGAVMVVGCVGLVVPKRNDGGRTEFTDEEIGSYDHRVPRYFLAAAFALVLGGIHMVVKNIPPFAHWLWEAGYGGHLFRDLSNSHIIIVGGGTVMLTGLTWYFLPRALGRPLFSEPLATASLWFTVIGVFGFYLSWLVLGLVEGVKIDHGMTYEAAKASLGGWHRVPTRMTSSIMGIGYWTYVLNVALTVVAGRKVRSPNRSMVKFLAVPAAALFVGTVQGVLQVLPANADWIHAAGEWGQYVDPISHAHINLVTGMVVALAGFVAYTTRARTPDLGPDVHDVGPGRGAGRVFWTLTSTSVAFYLVFLLLGLILGGAEVGSGGIQAPALASWLLPRAPGIVGLAGTALLAAFWIYFAFVIRHVGWSNGLAGLRTGAPAGFWLVSVAALFVGTLQGLGQALPATSHAFAAAEELPNVHAQLNMIGGVLLPLMATGMVVVRQVLGEAIPERYVRRTLWGVGIGIASYYLATVLEGSLRSHYLLDGMRDGPAAARVGWFPPALMLVAASVLLWGFWSFGIGVRAATVAYRAESRALRRSRPERVAGPYPKRLRSTPIARVVALEFVAALLGWPGPGWLYGKRVAAGVTLAILGPAITWALFPMLISPYNDTFLTKYGWKSLLVWLPATAALSAGLLGLDLWRRRRADDRRERGEVAADVTIASASDSAPAMSVLVTQP